MAAASGFISCVSETEMEAVLFASPPYSAVNLLNVNDGANPRKSDGEAEFGPLKDEIDGGRWMAAYAIG